MFVLLKLCLLSLLSLATTDLRVLFFTMDSCPPCKQMEPGIDQLERDGVEVSKIDVRQYADYARQCQVSQTPTTMVVQGNQVLARHSGALSYGQLQQMVATSQARTTNSPPRQPQPRSQPAGSSSKQAAPSQSNHTPAPYAQSTNSLTPEQLAHRATVRFRVEDAEGTSFATGTIIHRVGKEALVLTCGHVFRESQGQGIIHTDMGFAQNQPVTVVGKLMYYDAKEHDIALVAIPCPLEIQPIKVAPEKFTVQTGDKIFSLGCDGGDDPSVRQSVLKAVTRYSGIRKYDIVGRPVNGRSGGGLFSAGGQLLGVCNAAAVEVDEGIYTGLDSIYWQFAKTNLTHLFRRSSTPATRTADLQNGGRAAVHDNVVAKSNELTPPATHAIHTGGPAPVNQAIYRGGEMPLRTASQANQPAIAANDMEVIVLIRSKSDPRQSETITLTNPAPETLQWLRSEESRGPSLQDRMANLPTVPAPNPRSNAEIRAQSPR